MAIPLPDIEIINELFTYCPQTGVLTRAISTASNARAGDTVGSVDRYGYLRARAMGAEYKVHRIIWKIIHGIEPIGEIDHIDGNPANNRADNLRLASRRENAHNTRLFRNNTSGHKGISWNVTSKRWDARLAMGGGIVFRGRYVELQDAIEAVKEARKTNHKGFACHG